MQTDLGKIWHGPLVRHKDNLSDRDLGPDQFQVTQDLLDRLFRNVVFDECLERSGAGC